MKKIMGSHECSKSELDLFYSPPTNTSIVSSNYTNISLQKISGEETTFELSVPGTDEYTDLSDIYLKLEIILEKNGAKMDAQSKIGPINNFGHSLFKKIELKIGAGLNRKLVEVGNSHYAYKAYLLNLLNFGQEAKNTWIQSGCFYKDTSEQFDNIEIQATTNHKVKTEGATSGEIDVSKSKDANLGFIQRRAFFVKSKGKINVIIPIHVDMLHSNRFLMNNIGMYFEFERNKDSFLLMGSDTDYKIKITKINMFVRKCQINQAVQLAHISALQLAPAKYPIRQNKIIAISVDNDSKEYHISNFGHIIPSKIIFGLVEDEAYSGSLAKNPFNFKPFNLERITLIVDNVSKVIQMNQDDNDFCEPYHALCEGLNMYGSEGNNISITEYPNGNCLFFFNLCPDKGCCEQYNIIRSGVIQLKLEFSKNVEKKLKLITFLEYDNQINIDKKHEISFDYDL